MHPWPNHGEGSWTATSMSIAGTTLEETHKRMTKMRAEAMGDDLADPTVNKDEVAVGMLHPSCLFITLTHKIC